MNADYLQHCSQEYETLVAVAQAADGDEAALQAVHNAARYAWFHHPGRFVDPRLEALVVAIGQRLPAAPIELEDQIRHEFERRVSAPRHVLHVLSQALVIGGHTKLVMAWIRQDRSSAHSVALCSQEW